MAGTMAAAFFCGLVPMFGTLLTPKGGGLQSASLFRPIALGCEWNSLGEQWDPFVGGAVGYNYDLKLADVRLFHAGARYRLQPNPAWGKPAEEQTFLRPSTARTFDPYVTVAASYLNQTVYFIDESEKLSQAVLQSLGGALGAGVDWYALSDAKNPRGGDWRGTIVSFEARAAALPIALGNPAFQAILVQVFLGARYVY